MNPLDTRAFLFHAGLNAPLTFVINAGLLSGRGVEAHFTGRDTPRAKNRGVSGRTRLRNEQDAAALCDLKTRRIGPEGRW